MPEALEIHINDNDKHYGHTYTKVVWTDPNDKDSKTGQTTTTTKRFVDKTNADKYVEFVNKRFHETNHVNESNKEETAQLGKS